MLSTCIASSQRASNEGHNRTAGRMLHLGQCIGNWRTREDDEAMVKRKHISEGDTGFKSLVSPSYVLHAPINISVATVALSFNSSYVQ